MKIQYHCLPFILGLLISLSFSTKAQNIQEAYQAFNDQRYEVCRQIIDRLLESPQKQKESELWYLRGKAYLNIADDIRGTYTGQDTTALFRSYRSFTKSQLATPPNFADSSKIGLDSLHRVAMNIAGNYYKQAYQNNRESQANIDAQTQSYFSIAYQSAELAKKLNAKDTLGHSIAVYSSFLNQKYPQYIDAIHDYIEAVDEAKIKYKLYENLIGTCRDIINDLDLTLEALGEALIEFPDDDKFLQARIALNEEIGSNEQKLLIDARTKVKNEPGNSLNYYNLAVIYQRLERFPEALENYERCVRIDPSNIQAIYNIGGIYFNTGIKTLKEVVDMSFTDYQKNGKKLEARADDSFRKALPHFERLYKINQDYPQLKAALKQIYQRLKMKEKLQSLENNTLTLESEEGDSR